MHDLSELIEKWENSALNFREAETLINLLIVDNKRLEQELDIASQPTVSPDKNTMLNMLNTPIGVCIRCGEPLSASGPCSCR